MKPIVKMVLCCVGLAVPAWAEDVLETKGTVDSVTVYRGQALVTRMIAVPGPAGLREIVVAELPENVVPGSIYAESADGVEVRSVRYRLRPLDQDVREEVRQLDDQIRQLQDKLQANQQSAQQIRENREYLGKLEQFVAPTATAELSKGVLNAETLKSLLTFQFAQRQSLMEEELRLNFEQRDVNEKLSVLQRQRAQLTDGSARTAREAVILVNLQNDGESRLRLRYLVDRATWLPSYIVRADADRKQVVVEYSGSIQQMSGEDWPDVAMTLSTATPSLVARAPVMTPLEMRLVSRGEKGEQVVQGRGLNEPGEYAELKRDLDQRKRQVEAERGKSVGRSNVQAQQLQSQEGIAPQWAQSAMGLDNMPASQEDNLDLNLNQLAGELQMLELSATGKVGRQKSGEPKVDEGVSVTYQLPSRTTLPSRSDWQLIQIASLPMKAEFYRLASPVLTDYVYEESQVTNESKMVLLSGPASSFLSGQFVGHGQIPTVAAGEGFTVGFGIDSSLRTSRELVERTDSLQGGNRVVNFTYRLSVENFSDQSALVRVLDRLPQVKEAEVKLTLVSPGRDLSEDTNYVHTDRKKGLLRWDAEVPGPSIGPKAVSWEYQFRLEYDKQMSVSGMPVASR